jgi:hypothetical protein
MRVLWAHLQDEPADPCEGRSDVPPGFITALKSALRKEPGERPDSGVIYAQSLADAAGIPAADLTG